MKMKEGERALVSVAPQYAFGEQVASAGLPLRFALRSRVVVQPMQGLRARTGGWQQRCSFRSLAVKAVLQAG
jgi:hypothetical protein